MKLKLLTIVFLGLASRVLAQIDSLKNPNKVGEWLDKNWELTPEYRKGNFRISEYKPIYVAPIKWTDRPNRQPIGLNPQKPIPEYKDYQNVEAKFQVSLKAKVVQGMFFGKGDLWVGFTQVAHWQLYNSDLSRPFRETNYEPEVIFTYPLRFSAGDFKMKMIGLSLNHQSNGKEELNSRSWNRIILMSAYEYKNWTLMARFWRRLTESFDLDDNPEIQKYIGRGDFNLAYHSYRNTFWLSHRNNFSFNHNRSFTELTYGRSLFGNVKGIFQLSHGYGDSLLDYNHKQTALTFGILFADF